jgi:hypothetical protein
MQNEILTPENVSKDVLKAAFDAAFMDISFDSDGDLKLKDEVTCYVFLREKKDGIRLSSGFGFKEGTTELQQLQLINKINDEWRVVRAYVNHEKRALKFDYEILLAGGITVKNFILSVKKFCGIPRDAIADADKEGIVD